MSHGPEKSPVVSGGRQSGIVVGIDPGLDKHGVTALVASSCYLLDRRVIPNTVYGMQFLVTLLNKWRNQAAGRLTIGIEEATAFGEALEWYLREEGFEVVVVSSLKVSRFKEALGVDANDLVEAEAVARLLILQPDLGQNPAGDAIENDPRGRNHQKLRVLARRHERWRREQTAVCNELHAVLRMAWLADYQRFFSHVQGSAALAFWQTYPTPVEAAAATPSGITELLRKASRGRLSQATAGQRARQIHETARLMTAAFGRRDPHRWDAWAQDIQMLARHLAHLVEALQVIAKQIKILLAEIDTPLMSFKALGPITAATLHGEILSIDRFPTADHFARYNGTAPREDSSGRKPRHVKNYRCNKRLRQALMQLAMNATKYHEESKRYLQRLAANGLTGGAARLRLARRLSDVIYAMLKQNRRYDLSYHLRKKVPAA